MTKDVNALIKENLEIQVDMSSIIEQFKSITDALNELKLPILQIPKLHPDTIQAVQEMKLAGELFAQSLHEAFEAQFPRSEMEKVISNLSGALRSSFDATVLVSNLSSSVLTHIDNLPEAHAVDAKIAITRASDVTLDQIRVVVRDEIEQSETRSKPTNRNAAIFAFVYFVLSTFISLYPDKARDGIALIGHYIEQAVIASVDDSDDPE